MSAVHTYHCCPFAPTNVHDTAQPLSFKLIKSSYCPILIPSLLKLFPASKGVRYKVFPGRLRQWAAVASSSPRPSLTESPA